MWLLSDFGIVDREPTLMSRSSTPWLPLTVLCHWPSVIDGQNLIRGECMRNAYER